MDGAENLDLSYKDSSCPNILLPTAASGDWQGLEGLLNAFSISETPPTPENEKSETRRRIPTTLDELSELDSGGWSALHHACYHGYEKCIDVLLKYGADPNLQASEPTKRPIIEAYDSSPFVTLSLNRLEVCNEGEHFETVVCSLPVSSSMKKRWYFEVVCLTSGILQIGWSSKFCSFSPLKGIGVGDTACSFAYDGYRQKRWTCATSINYGKRWKSGDVIGCLLDTQKREISYSLNGEDLGVAFEDVDELVVGSLYPSASLSSLQRIRFIFEHHNLTYPPRGDFGSFHIYQPVDQFLLENWSPVNHILLDRSSALHCCSFSGHLPSVSLLLDLPGCIVDSRDHYMNTPLIIAAHQGNLEVCRILIEKGGANVNATNTDRNTSLHYSAMNGHERVLQYLIEKQALVDEVNSLALTPLFLACRYGHTRCASTLLRCGANPCQKRANGVTPLHESAAMGHYECVATLLSRGADPNCLSQRRKETPLHYCGLVDPRNPGHVQCAKILLSQGADVQIRNTLNYTPFLLMMQANCVEVAEVLLAHGADSTCKAVDHCDAVHLAADAGALDSLKFLHRHGVNLQTLDVYNYTATVHAVVNGYTDCLKFLLDHTTNLTSSTSNSGLYVRASNTSDTLLHMAAREGHLDCIKLLLQRGIDVNIPNALKQTPLHYALFRAHMNCVLYLLEEGANLLERDSKERAALSLVPIEKQDLLLDYQNMHAKLLQQRKKKKGKVRKLILEYDTKEKDMKVTNINNSKSSNLFTNSEKYEYVKRTIEKYRSELKEIEFRDFDFFSELFINEIVDLTNTFSHIRRLIFVLASRRKIINKQATLSWLIRKLPNNIQYLCFDGSISKEGVASICHVLSQTEFNQLTQAVTSLNLTHGNGGTQSHSSSSVQLHTSTASPNLNTALSTSSTLPSNSNRENGGSSTSSSTRTSRGGSMSSSGGSNSSEQEPSVITGLSFPNNGLSFEDFKPLFELLTSYIFLKELSFQGNRINVEGVELLYKSLEKNSFVSLTTLNLNSTNLRSKAGSIIGKMIEAQHIPLTHLYLAKNQLEDDGVKPILLALIPSHYAPCPLSAHVYIAPPTPPPLPFPFSSAPTPPPPVPPQLPSSLTCTCSCKLETLDISSNYISATSLQILCQVLETNSSLINLDVSHNKLTSNAGWQIRSSLTKNFRLLSLNLVGNRTWLSAISSSDIDAIAKLLQNNKRKRKHQSIQSSSSPQRSDPSSLSSSLSSTTLSNSIVSQSSSPQLLQTSISPPPPPAPPKIKASTSGSNSTPNLPTPSTTPPSSTSITPSSSKPSDKTVSSPVLNERLHVTVDSTHNLEIERWNEKEVGKWLMEIGFPQYKETFLQNDINGKFLSELTEEHLRQLQINSLGHRLAILDAIKELHKSSSSMSLSLSQSGAPPSLVPPTSFLGSSGETENQSPEIGSFDGPPPENSYWNEPFTPSMDGPYGGPLPSFAGNTLSSQTLPGTITTNIDTRNKTAVVHYREIAFEELEMEEIPIGTGAFGVVFKGTWRGAPVAVKKILAMNELLLQDLKQEATLMHMLGNHPNVVRLVGAVTVPPYYCLVTDYYPQGSVYDALIKKKKNVPQTPVQMQGGPSPQLLVSCGGNGVPVKWNLLVKVARDAAAGILHLHCEGVIHRDIACRNLLLDESWNVHVADFGLSRIKKHNAEYGKTSSNIGPVKWMAPEAIMDRKYSEKSDAFSFGVVLWELVCRKIPYDDMEPVNVAMGVVHNSLRLTIPTDCDPMFAELMKRCWEQRPERRPDFKFLYDRLQSYVSLIGAQSEPPPLTSSTPNSAPNSAPNSTTSTGVIPAPPSGEQLPNPSSKP